MNTRRLPRVEAEFNVISPTGGFRRQLRNFDIGVTQSLDIEIENGYGIHSWLRVVPKRSEVVLDPVYSSIYMFHEAQGLYITGPGGRELPDKPVSDVWMSIDVNAAPGMPAGKLKLWEISENQPPLGA